MRKILLSALIAATFAAAPAIAQPMHAEGHQGNVRLLGVTRLSQYENDIDVIPVQCRPRIAAVKLRARSAPAEIEHVSLTFANGERQRLPIREVLDRGEETRWIDLRGGRRCVTSIALIGDTERGGRRHGYRDAYRDDDYRDGRRDGYRDHDYRDGRRYDARYDEDDRDYRGERHRGGRQAQIQVFGRSW